MRWMRSILLSLACLLVAVALFSPFLGLHDPNGVSLGERLAPPFSPGHVLGTDMLGRDVFSRLMVGVRTSLGVALAATAISMVLGSTIGLLSGYHGGRTDAFLMRGVELVMAFPYLVFALAIVAVLGPGLLNALFAIGIVNVPFVARTVRGATLTISKTKYVEAARALGGGDARILNRHIIPNLLPTLMTASGTTFSWMLLETAGLSFIGLGAQPPDADLGTMLADTRRLMLVYPHAPLIPGLALMLLALAVNLLAGRRK